MKIKEFIIAILVILGIILMVGIAGCGDSDRYIEANLRENGKVSKNIILGN